MSILKNFKADDPKYEKRILAIILGVPLTVCLMYLIHKGLERIPDFTHLFIDNAKYFGWFLLSSFGVLLLSALAYGKSLDIDEFETKATVIVSVISVILWTIIWISWGIFCAWLTFNFSPLTLLVKFTIIGLVTIPGVTAFLISRNDRLSEIKQDEASKIYRGKDNFRSDFQMVCIERKYFSGYYGLLCLPVYLISLLVGHLL